MSLPPALLRIREGRRENYGPDTGDGNYGLVNVTQLRKQEKSAVKRSSSYTQRLDQVSSEEKPRLKL